MKYRKNPFLSVCVPTHDRGELLRCLLISLVPQVKELGDEVELIVSDNCSTDNTPEVVQWARQYGPIRYNRNAENIGLYGNILLLANELAQGEFCWIIGDDDMIIKDKLRGVLRIIHSHPTVDYFFVNYFFKTVNERDCIILKHDSQYAPDLGECMCIDFTERQLPMWEDLLSVHSRNPPAMFTAIVCNIFRTSLWRAHVGILSASSEALFSSFDNTFPHIKVLAHAMVGRPAYYIGDPCVLLGQGSQEWIGYWDMITIVRLNDALELYEDLDIDRRRLEGCRRFLLRHSQVALGRMLLDPHTPARQFFSLRKFLWRNRREPGELIRLFAIIALTLLAQRLPGSVYRSLRAQGERFL